ncbi:hypothetical protein NDU88_004834 [Pleurodeles waltl]|uniref:Uncharacterized protein n=1 Tax=Pleurodeles waltl TaxID=8319 RepID=A0AAV7VHC6_PLEWA|nr:hypothetical protein NDU88_004834 [Pleurodeles waltl]
MQLAPAQVNRTKTAGLRLQKKSPGRQLRSPHRATRQLPDALNSRSASQVKTASFTGVPQISPVAGSSRQHRRGEGGEPGRHQVPEPGCLSPRHQGVPQKHTAAPARASAPRLTSRVDVHLILCCQGSAGPSVQYVGPQQGLAGRRPGAKPKPSQVVFPPGPRIQAPASSNLLAVSGPGSHHRSAPSARLLLAGPSTHQLGTREARKSSPVEGRTGPRGSVPPAAVHARKKKLPCTLGSSPSRPEAAAAPPLPHTHRLSQCTWETAGARPTNTDPASGRSQQPNPAHIMSLGSPGGCLRGPLPSMPPVG